MSLHQRFTHGVFWSLIGTVAGRLFALAVSVVTARLLGKVGFGELGMLQSTIGLMGTLAGFGLGITTTKYVAELKEKDPERTGRIIALSNLTAIVSGGLMALVCVAGAPWLAQKTLNAPHLVPELRIGAALLFVSALLGVQTGSLSGFQSFRTIARINFFQGLFSLPLALILIYFWGLRGAVLYLIASALVGIVLSSRALSQEYAAAGLKAGLRGAWTERRILWNFSFPAVISGSMVTPITWAANAILVNQPNGYAELGLFNAANQFRMIVILIPNVLAIVTVPLLSEIYSQKDREYFARATNLNLRTIWSFALPCGFIVIALSSWLMELFGPQFQGGRLVLSLMVCVTIMIVTDSTVGQTLISSGKMWTGFLLNLGWALILLPSAAYLVPSMGAVGLALSYFISYSFLTFGMLIYTAAKFGRQGVQYSPLLSLLTGLIFILSIATGRIPESIFISLALIFAVITGIIAWEIIDLHNKNKIKEIIKSLF